MRIVVASCTIALGGALYLSGHSPIANQLPVENLTLNQEHVLSGDELDLALARKDSLNNVISGNFPNSIMSGNFPDAVMSGNFPDAVMSGNFPTSSPFELKSGGNGIPSPVIAI